MQNLIHILTTSEQCYRNEGIVCIVKPFTKDLLSFKIYAFGMSSKVKASMLTMNYWLARAAYTLHFFSILKEHVCVSVVRWPPTQWRIHMIIWLTVQTLVIWRIVHADNLKLQECMVNCEAANYLVNWRHVDFIRPLHANIFVHVAQVMLHVSDKTILSW